MPIPSRPHPWYTTQVIESGPIRTAPRTKNEKENELDKPINPFITLRDNILRENLKDMGQGPDPCMVSLIAVAVDETVQAVIEHSQLHGLQELELLESRMGRRQLLRLRIYKMKMEDTGERDMSLEPPEVTEIIEEGFSDQVDASELAVLFNLLPMLAARADAKASKITAGRPFYDTARQLLGELLGWHFPGVSLPTDDAEGGQTAETTSPAPALDGGATTALSGDSK